MKILSPAKINLFLHVCGKRADGYHELISLMCCIDLYDEISLWLNSGDGIEVICTHPNVPQDATNLAYQAARLFKTTLNIRRGLKIIINKNIPVAAGLGGGSSNAASVLHALNHLYGYPFSQNHLMKRGLTIGADVPFFIFQKPAIVTGIGEKLEAFPGALPYHILLLYPRMSVSTREIYRNLNFGLTKVEKKPKSNLLTKHEFDVKQHLTNDLESVTAKKYPEIVSIKKKMVDLGALGALMTGSGPTVFGLFNDIDKAESAKQALALNQNWQLFLAKPIVASDPKIIDT
jgi:4-diphosphocytidyl-2-C-methyl-D-erythritol kinase